VTNRNKLGIKNNYTQRVILIKINAKTIHHHHQLQQSRGASTNRRERREPDLAGVGV